MDGVSARVPECQKIKNGGLAQYGSECLTRLFLSQSEKFGLMCHHPKCLWFIRGNILSNFLALLCLFVLLSSLMILLILEANSDMSWLRLYQLVKHLFGQQLARNHRD